MVNLGRKSQSFYLIQRIQDEVHRFAITFHRSLRGKNAIRSELDQIPGVGEKRRRLLLSHFKSITEIKQADLDTMTRLGIPKPTAETILHHLNQEKDETHDADDSDVIDKIESMEETSE
ncbi:helix-hairpin-helix domain-containing protein [Halolactibacillus sp. JCM 19043]|uniref:helix-hairpin-helix domain-containing protein n=1 Tax=Halolactibacillus sp. JCM 19043 TaxID=1460638 RepID=UPI00351804F4